MILNFEKIQKQYGMNIDGVIHIGAHYGSEYPIYQKLNINNMIFFEPLRENFNHLVTNVPQTEKILLINKALGRENKKMKMFVETANNGQSSSLLKPKIHLQQYSNIVFDKEEEVDMITLDEFMIEKGFQDENPFNLINIDVQGYELEVFKGAINTLKNIDYIVTEVNRVELYEDNVIVYELDKFLKQYDFERVETVWEGITWGDALYIKR